MSETGYKALLIDTVSIQQYIFGSNKLKENIGASYIIENKVFGDVLKNALNAAGLGTVSLTEWCEYPDHYHLTNDDHARVEIGYIGGGNAMLLFRYDDDRKAFISHFTKTLLRDYPGIRTAFGFCDDFQYENPGFQQARKKLNKSLQQNKSLAFRQVTLPKPGIVNDCPLSNEAQEVPHGPATDQQTISVPSKVKFNVLEEAQETLYQKHNEALGQEFAFTSELDQLGQPDDKGYISVVHIDGNSMGGLFSKKDSLHGLRKLSHEVQERTRTTMETFIKEVANLFRKDGPLNRSDAFTLPHFQAGKNATVKEKKWEEEKRRTLPIRPLITAGDDITFVCEGRLGVYLAEQFVDLFTKDKLDGHDLHACAGIAIVKTKYPFYRAYTLAEELTKRAKEPSRQQNGSYLQHLISSSGFSGTLPNILHRQFATQKGLLINGPYRIRGGDDASGHLPHIHTLKRGIKHFNDKWARNKMMKLRDVLRQSEASQELFIAEMAARNEIFPDGNPSLPAGQLWSAPGNDQTATTPYYDMIELTDFYPKELLDQKVEPSSPQKQQA